MVSTAAGTRSSCVRVAAGRPDRYGVPASASQASTVTEFWQGSVFSSPPTKQLHPPTGFEQVPDETNLPVESYEQVCPTSMKDSCTLRRDPHVCSEYRRGGGCEQSMAAIAASCVAGQPLLLSSTLHCAGTAPRPALEVGLPPTPARLPALPPLAADPLAPPTAAVSFVCTALQPPMQHNSTA
jgi:hypothetical protein